MSYRNSSSGTSGSASSPSSGVSSQITGSHQQQQHTAGQQNSGNSQAALAAQLVSQQLLMHGSLGALGAQEIQALASTFQQQQQSLQQQLQQLAMFQQANSAAAGQLPAQAQFFLQNQVCRVFFHVPRVCPRPTGSREENFVAGKCSLPSPFETRILSI